MIFTGKSETRSSRDERLPTCSQSLFTLLAGFPRRGRTGRNPSTCGRACRSGCGRGETLSTGIAVPPRCAACRARGWSGTPVGNWRGVMADTLTSISRRRGSALALVNPACTSQIDSRTGLLQGRCRGDRFDCLDGVVPDADANDACNIPARLCDDGITLYIALQGRARPARGTNRDRGGDCSTRTRVAGACNAVPINRERSTRNPQGLRNRDAVPVVGAGHRPHYACPAGTLQLGHRDRARLVARPAPAGPPWYPKTAPIFTDALALVRATLWTGGPLLRGPCRPPT